MAPKTSAKKRSREVCTGKRRYPDELTAKTFGMHCAEKTGLKELYTYRCSVCGGWHLTKHPRSFGETNKWIFNFA